MRIELTDKKVLFVHFSGRSEIHGNEREPAGDIKIRATLPNTILKDFHGTLLPALYFHDTANPGNDLADKAMEDKPDYLPHRRFPNMASPLKWQDNMVGGVLTIHHGISARSDLVLKDIEVHKFEIAPKDGGTVELSFTVKCKPDEKQAGKLYQLIQNEVNITLTAPKPDELQEGDLVGGGEGADGGDPASTDTSAVTA